MDPIPPRRRLCPVCRQPVIPRTRADGVRVVLCEADLPAFEDWNRRWKVATRAQRDHDAWMEKTARMVGADVPGSLRAELGAQLGYSAQDIYWAGANRAVLQAFKASDWQRASMLFYEMGFTAYEESREDQASERVLELRREANLAKLREYAAYGLEWVDILACGCRTCSRGATTRLAINDQLWEPSIPHADCAEGWCRCDYTPAFA